MGSVRLPPLVPVAAAVVTGAACGGEHPSSSVCLALLWGSVVAAIVVRRRPSLVLAFAMAAGWCLGASAQAAAWRDGAARLSGLLRGAARRDAEICAVVLSAPQPRIDGTQSLRVETVATPDSPAARMRLVVATVPMDDRGRLEALRRGDVVRVWCRIRAPARGPGSSASDARRRLFAQRLDATAWVKSSRLVRKIVPGRWSVGRALDAFHITAARRLDVATGPRGTTRAVLGAMLLGDRGLLSEDVVALLRDAGLVHLLSISGLHTGMSVLVLLAVLRRCGSGPRGLLIGGGLALFALAALVGHGASVWRACGSLGVVLTARAVGREVESIAALALAAAALVLAVPGLAWNPGFLLSVLATAGLVASIDLTRPARGIEGSIGRGLMASAGAYAATIPVLARLFGRLAPVALVASLVAVPLCAACLATGAATVALVGVPVIGRLVAAAAAVAVNLLLATARFASLLPGGHLRVAAPCTPLVAAFAAALVATWLWDGSRAPQAGRALRLLVVLMAIALHLGPIPPAAGPARIEVLDVGQGLSVMLRGPDGGVVLYDAGPTGGGRFDAGDRIVVPALASNGSRRVEVLALSHDHDDHAGGALAVLRDRDVGELWLPAGSERDTLTRKIAAEAVAKGVAVRRMSRGQSQRVAGLTLEVLHPGPADRTRPVNDRCLALRASTAHGTAVVLPGDLEAEGERALMGAAGFPTAQALVAPHHGADGSSTREFLAAVGARVIAISAGAGNRFGHPGDGSLARYAAIGARVARTDRDGTIVLEDDGSGWRVSVDHDRSGDEGEDEDDGE